MNKKQSEDTTIQGSVSRRGAIAGIAAIGASGMIASAGHNAMTSNALVGGSTLTADELGWDAKSEEYVLPDLPYEYDALSMVIDEQTMRIHHDKHHAGYVKGLNNAIKKLDLIRWDQGDPSLIQHWQRQLSFHMGGHINHTLFWSGMKSEFGGGGGQPTGNLSHLIKISFGSFGKFEKQFKLAATKVEGSGWGWLVYEPRAKRLMVTQMQNQQDMMLPGSIPLLGVDVWEHAYYLKYQNKRADYVDGFMRVINWDEVSRRLEIARRMS